MKRGSFKRREDVKIVAGAAGFARKVLEDNELSSLERLLRVHEGTYIIFGGGYFGALCIARDSAEIERDPKHKFEGRDLQGRLDPQRCCASRINYGIMLKSETPSDVNVLNVVDLYFSEAKTKLWFPWMDYRLVECRKGYGEPVGLCGSLYVSVDSFSLQSVLRELTFAEENVKRYMTQEYSRILGGVETPKYILPMDSAECPVGDAGPNVLEYFVSGSTQADFIHLQPMMGSHNVYFFSGSEEGLAGESISDIALKPIFLKSKPKRVRLVRPQSEL